MKELSAFRLDIETEKPVLIVCLFSFLPFLFLFLEANFLELNFRVNVLCLLHHDSIGKGEQKKIFMTCGQCSCLISKLMDCAAS